jgi:3-oxoacyl-[acyl-carrier protein] reductase
MDLQLNGKSALVTGATAGIGLAIAEELAREGAAVTITGRAQDKIERALDTIGNGAKGIVADLSNAPGTEPLFARLSRADILVNIWASTSRKNLSISLTKIGSGCFKST